MSPTHAEDGEFVEETTHDDILGVFDTVDCPVLTSADVADTLDSPPDGNSINYTRGDG